MGLGEASKTYAKILHNFQQLRSQTPIIVYSDLLIHVLLEKQREQVRNIDYHITLPVNNCR